MTRYIFVVLLVALTLAGCVQTSKVVCNEPYIMVGDSCCLDKDANGVCDKDEATAVECNDDAFDCSSCPPKIVTETEEIETIKYICKDGSTIVDAPEDCVEATKEPEVQFTPITTNEDDQPVIKEFRVRPACLGFQSAEFYFDVGTAANNVEFQVKEVPTDKWKTVYTFSSPVFEKYVYMAFCDSKCTENADFFLPPGKKYLIRAKFDYSETSWKEVFYSNEHVLDHTEDGEYATKLC